MEKSVLISALCGLAVLASCGGGHGHGHGEGAESEDEHGHGHNPDEIVMTHEQMEAAGVEVSEVVAGEFHGVIRTSGVVEAASGAEATLVATESGVVSLVRPVTEGMAVSAGTAMFTISSANLPEGDNVQRVRIAYEAAKREYERAAELVKDRIVTERDFNAARSEYETARLAYEAVSKNSTGRGVAVKSPMGGYVKECMVREGDYVEVGAPMMTVAQDRRLCLRAEVSERDYGSLGRIVSANFKTAYSDSVFSIKDLDGRLLSVGKGASGGSPYIPVTFEFDNRSGIVPGSYAEVFLITGARDGVVSVPVSALTDEQGVAFVYMQDSDHSFSKREVRVGISDGVRTEILAGLKVGERVVTKGAISVRLAGTSKSIPGHSHSH